MNERISNIQGVGEAYSEKLEYVGIKTVSELLAKTQTSQDRSELARRSGIPVGYIDNWATMLDLTRVDGIGYQFAELLTYSGIRSVEDFRKRNSESLYETLSENNTEKNFTAVTPSVSQLDNFIANAKEITNIIERY